MPPTLDFRNTNSLWCSVLVETLARLGVDYAVVSPGSRSTPLTFAFVAHPQIGVIPVLDERSAAFFALGLAKRSGRPVALVCTSGTAGANYLPAIVEAHESGVPLLVLTADRPPELRACASGQTIDQQKIFGGFVGFYHECAVPEPRLELLRYLRQTVAHAVGWSQQPPAGPVHLNCPFRDPLPPVDDGGAAAALKDACEWPAFFAHLTRPVASGAIAELPELNPSWRGLIVAGPEATDVPARYAASIGMVARKLGWPLLADGVSPVRNHAELAVNLVTAYDAILRGKHADLLRPEVVICCGGWPTSKVLRGWLEKTDPEILLVTARPAANRDGLHGRTRQVVADLPTWAGELPWTKGRNAFTTRWLKAERVARAALDRGLKAAKELFEPKAAWLLARHLPVDTPVFVASSMPVRDMEYFWPANNRRAHFHFNRGANGIDGTLSTALGVAHGGTPTVLLTGDLALLHDTNGFLLRPKLRGSLTVVLINNRGGGIFEHLPVAKFDPPFEDFVATPQEVDFARLCAAYDIEHVPVSNWAQFTELVSTLPKRGIRVLELRTDRKHDAAKRKKLLAAAGAKRE